LDVVDGIGDESTGSTDRSAREEPSSNFFDRRNSLVVDPDQFAQASQ
jgi:hypothetical protein